MGVMGYKMEEEVEVEGESLEQVDVGEDGGNGNVETEILEVMIIEKNHELGETRKQIVAN